MKKPVFRHSQLTYTLSAILTIPLLIDFCTACHLFPLWLAWSLFTLIGIISCVRLWFAFSQKCYKFAWGLIGQVVLGAVVLTFFQLSYTHIIQTPVSNPETPAILDIAPPIPALDSIHSDDKDNSKEKEGKETYKKLKKDSDKKSEIKIHKEENHIESNKHNSK